MMTVERRGIVQWAAVALLSLGTILMASEAAKPVPALTAEAKWHVIASYQKAVIAQQQAQAAQKAMNDAIADYNALVVATVKESRLPAGTTLQVTPDMQDVTVVAPPAPAPPEKK
jgi:predicted Zn-dependent protease